MAYNPRRANGSKRSALLRRLRASGAPCWICGHPIDPSIPQGSPLCMEADELLPVSLGGSPFDPSNIAAAHQCCNRWRGNKTVAAVRAVQKGVESLGGSTGPLDWIAKAKKVLNAVRSNFGAAPKTTTDW